jgi:anaerobic magnesium-protoporphyrin IX monomethyl ester cyclase
MARVLFFQDTPYEAFGPQLLAAVLKARGHACDLLVVSEVGRRGVVDEARRFNPDLAAFSITSCDFRWALDLAAELKSRLGVVNVFGGPHPSCFPDFVREPAVDFACRGEGEETIVDLAEAVASGADPRAIPNLSFARDGEGPQHNPVRPLLTDLDALPYQDRSLHYRLPLLRRFSYKLFLAGRGCPYDCSYCFNTTLRAAYRGRGPWVRHRSPEHVVGEILDVRSRWGLATVGFVDDSFASDKRWLLSFCELYQREVALPFNCIVRINQVDEEMAEALGRSGCHFVSFAVETGSEELRRRVLNRPIADSEIRSGAALLRRQGIRLLTCNMFGLPGETLEDGLATVRLNREIGTELLGTSVLQPMPGTAVFATAQRLGLLGDEAEPGSITSFTASSPLLPSPTLAALINLQKLAFLGLRCPRLLPLLKRLVKLPPNPLFNLVHVLSQFVRFKVRCRLSLAEAVSLGLRSWRRFS